ncbi:hypothetical protein K4749_34350 [Streptomyces sp. TRM72054]|uniref:hypothetical protein n=1 Tax=Streptomyces sp. TRM72054 TaxID=2870562 RepID=UPI001C8C6A03|nr:hypothetical protein [Streptomyces sp. TRM72054]MBX9398528.1 hypothetical protein [Streptomyces sp. TRM72054]
MVNEQNAIRRGAFAALAPSTVLAAVAVFLGLIDTCITVAMGRTPRDTRRGRLSPVEASEYESSCA